MPNALRLSARAGGLVLSLLTLATGCSSTGSGTPAPTAAAPKYLAASAAKPLAAPAAPAPTADAPRPLNMMTVNLQHRDRPNELQAVANLLKADPARTPDVIFCQEVWFGRGGALDSTADVLASYLGYHARGTKRTSDREGIAIVSKYPIEFYESINLKSQTSALLLGFRRVSTMAEVTVPSVGRVRLVNVHFTNWGFEQHVRRKQLQETLEWAAARERVAPAAMTFLAGDFNAEATASEMALVKDRTVTGPLAFRGWNGSQPSRGGDVRIDFIFVAPGTTNADRLAFAGEELLWKDGVPAPTGRFTLSDHLPVLHRYHIAPAAPTIATPARPTAPVPGSATGSAE